MSGNASIAVVVMAAAVALGGCSDSSPDDGTGGSGGGEGCVDVTLTPNVLAGADEWLWYGTAIPGGLWASNGRTHSGWMAYRLDPSANGQQVPTLIVSSIADGQPKLGIDHVRYELFPEGTYWTETGQVVLAGKSDGAFAVGYDWWQGKLLFHTALGRVGVDAFDANPLVGESGGSANVVAHTAAAWDGEAFALHAYGGPPQFTLHVARVSDTGSVLLPFTQYGITSTAAPGVSSHATSTSPESGRTYVFDANGKNLLRGHLRDGTPLPGTETGPKIIVANGTVPGLSSLATASADADGAWLAWWHTNGDAEFGYQLVVQRIDIDGTPAGTPAFPSLTPLDDPAGTNKWVVVSRGSSVVLFTASSASIYRFEYDGTKLSAPLPVLKGGQAGELDIRDLEAIDHDGETWISYSQNNEPGYLRVLKAIPGCVYPSTPEAIP